MYTTSSDIMTARVYLSLDVRGRKDGKGKSEIRRDTSSPELSDYMPMP